MSAVVGIGAGGMFSPEILEAYPDLEPEDIVQAISPQIVSALRDNGSDAILVRDINLHAGLLFADL